MNEVLELQALPVADEVAGLKRKSRRQHGHGSSSICLVSLNGSANGIVADVLNIFGGSF